MIKFYTTHCPKCLILKKKMDMKNISYEEITDVEYMKTLDIMTVPCLQVGEEIMTFENAIKYVNNL